MLKALLNKRFPLAFRSDRERTEQIIRIVIKNNYTDIDKLFRSSRADVNAQKEIFDVIHEQYGERILSTIFRDRELSQKVMNEALMKLMLLCEIRYQTAPV
jgi:hypothetical protein